MALTTGSRVGLYDIIAPLGAGGMGEVYRAKDTKLGRDVALKILPATFTSDPDRLARFRREAQVLAVLNHPHIGAIYGLDEANGTQFLVLELVDGESLDKRIARGKIPVDEALGIARQIAEALEAAHDKGIIHRDLKPANIALTRDGTVKVLDFGLAKATEPASGASLDVTYSPTITSPAMVTGVGVILGTAAYMSPEQAKGKPVDKRSDIWAFGCVLFEMVTGKRAFDGEDVSDTIANVLKSQPTWSALPLEVGPPIRALIEACLRKDRVARVGDLATAKFVINELTPLWRTPVAHVTTQQRWTMVGAVIAIVTVILAVGLILMNQVAHRPAGLGIVTRFALSLGAGDRLPALDQSHRVVDISPDGTRIVFAANRQLYLRRLDELDATPIRGTALGESSNLESDPVDPFFSTDGQWVGFWQAGQLKKVSAAGGTPTVICIVPRPTAGASWGADDAILFGLGPEGIWRVSSAGGTPQPLVPVSSGQGALNPQLIAANQVLYTERTVRGATPRADQIVVYSITDGTRHVIVDNGSAGRYLTTGHLVYVTDGVIQGIRFDVPRLTSSGGAVPLVEGIAQSNVFAAAHYAVSHTGTLVFAPEQAGGRMLVWVDRHGREEPISAPARGYADPRLSPDGTRIAVAISRPEKDRGVWIWDSSRTNLVRLTADKRGSHPIWSRDGRYVVFSSGEGIQRLAADGSGTLEHLFASTLVTFPDTLTGDGRELLVEQRNQAAMRQQWDVSVVSTKVDRRIFPLLTGPSNERSAELSPDGRWIAYVSDESGLDEVYVRRYPNVNDGRWPVSVDGGRDPVWARNGRELFYVASGGRIMAVTVRTEPAFSAERPIQLLSGYEPTGLGRYFDVAPDGDRFLLLKEKKSSETPRLIVVENWFEELKSRVPTK